MKKPIDKTQKIEMKGWSRREFLNYSLRLGLFAQVWAGQEAIAKSTYNFAFWKLNVANTILQVSELSAAVVISGGASTMAVSETSLLAGVGLPSAGTRMVSEVYVMVVAKV